MSKFDVVLIGAGAAVLFCAGVAGQRGLRVLLLDHAAKVAEKIRISGGGRSNFTNREVGPQHFHSENPAFARSALTRFSPQDFIALVQRHGIAFHEKHKGQLFCDRSAEDLISMLLAECAAGGVTRRQPCGVRAVRRVAPEAADTPVGPEVFELDTEAGVVRAQRLVIATGGLSIPQIGATDWGQRLAADWGHRVLPLRPALVPLTFAAADWAPFVPLAGLSLPVHVATGEPVTRGRPKPGTVPGAAFDEDLLFTHRGLSGPAILQISTWWTPGQPLRLVLHPGQALGPWLREAKLSQKRQLANALGGVIPQRLADLWIERQALSADRPLPDCRDKDLDALAASVHGWSLVPAGTEGYRKAEVTAGGVDTRELNQQSMESRRVPGLHFIGEVVDVTGWLGGYNFQWAWSSAAACADALAA